MTATASFHVRHDLTPQLARETLLLLRAASGGTRDELIARARARGLEIGRRRSPDKVLASLRDLGLVERSRTQGQSLALTRLGQRVADVALRDELLLPEIIHLRYVSLWTPEVGGDYFSWSYQTVASLIWDWAPTTIDSDRMVATILAAAEREFAVRNVSFSSSSVLGILHWLRALRPSCLDGGRFLRRSACPPEAFVLAIERIQSIRGRPPGAPLRLDADTRERICRNIMLDEGAFDEMLALAEETIGLIRRSGDGGDVVLLRESALPGLVA